MKRIIPVKARLLCFFLISSPLWLSSAEPGDSFSQVGLRLAELLEQFGPPRAVFAARGNEPWQDDVIFQYEGRDFYIHRDRVWQVKPVSEQGITIGDPKQAALLALGNRAEDRGDHLIMPVTGRNWPMMLRVNFNSSSRVSAIYIYRMDYSKEKMSVPDG
jgi:hypothetical protein